VTDWYGRNSAAIALVTAYEKLNVRQSHRLSDLMKTQETAWPEDLRAFVRKQRAVASNPKQEPLPCWVAQWLRELEDGMTQEQRDREQYRKNNKGYLGLTDDQCDMHRDIMSMKMNEWPESLKTYCQGESKKYGFCGDALACWVADWLKAGNVVVEPPETPEDEEAARLAALKTLQEITTQ